MKNGIVTIVGSTNLIDKAFEAVDKKVEEQRIIKLFEDLYEADNSFGDVEEFEKELNDLGYMEGDQINDQGSEFIRKHQIEAWLWVIGD